ncbi:hypothetical protein SAMN04488067_11843 [Halorubrum xinjiangense]|uniref:DUF8135 domain-containing protein n=1 Tax=Halorubrum xinjiangense TaxID=261291 RepID=A0A1G7S2A6_9EURY|nr:hypothetical protein [Halorubrum xinjiangense]SDG17185.1 hypothetical protein SAMN04488067_11843 [Halorubrum xinjiangense]
MSDGDRSDGDDGSDPFGDGLFGDKPGDAPDADKADDGFDDPDTDEVDDLFDDPDADKVDDGFDDSDTDEVSDPFAALGEGVDDGGEASSWADPEPDATADPEPSAPADDPFAELDGDAAGAPTDEDPFESMGSGDVGEEDVWEALDEGTSIGAEATEFGDDSEGGAVGDVGEPNSGVAGQTPGAGPTGDEHVIDKRSYCQRCPHFTAPPETACSHEGTEIVESVDFSRFRVRNCPMVDTEDPAFDEE